MAFVLKLNFKKNFSTNKSQLNRLLIQKDWLQQLKSP